MKKILNIIFITTFVLITGCATVYLSPDGQGLANKHDLIAILPPNVVFKSTKKMSAETVKQQQEDESKIFQQEIYTYLLKRKIRGQMVINIQDVEETNVAINRNDLDLTKMTSSEICELLEVDGILSSQFGLSKPMSAGVAIALLLLTDIAGSTNEVTISLSLKDCNKGSVIYFFT